MDTLWFGIKIGVGIAVGLSIFAVAVGLFKEIRAVVKILPFHLAHFTYQTYSGMSGWLTRDPHNDDWILWEENRNVVLRSTDQCHWPTDQSHWRATRETKKQCIALGREYWNSD